MHLFHHIMTFPPCPVCMGPIPFVTYMFGISEKRLVRLKVSNKEGEITFELPGHSRAEKAEKKNTKTKKRKKDDQEDSETPTTYQKRSQRLPWHSNRTISMIVVCEKARHRSCRSIGPSRHVIAAIRLLGDR